MKKLLQYLVLGSALLTGRAVGQTIEAYPALNTKIFQEYKINTVTFMNIDVSGKKPTIYEYTPVSDSMYGQKIVGIITGCTDLNTKIGSDPEYDIKMWTAINEKGYPVKSITIRYNQDKPPVSKPKDLEQISLSKLEPAPGDKITEFSCEIYMPILDDTLHKKIINIGTDSVSIVPAKTFDFLSCIQHIITHPQNPNSDKPVRKYHVRHYGNDSDFRVLITKHDEYLEAEAKIPDEIKIPLGGGLFQYHIGQAPFHIEANLKFVPLNPSADAKRK